MFFAVILSEAKDPRIPRVPRKDHPITEYAYVYILASSFKHLEKELKGWLRSKKIALIVANNPDWTDLSKDWGKPFELLDKNV